MATQAITYTSQASDTSPLATGSIVCGSDGAANGINVQCGFVPSAVILWGTFGQSSAVTLLVWSNSTQVNALTVILAAALVGAAAITSYAGAAGEEPGFTIAAGQLSDADAFNWIAWR